jgi:hypothetical protein
MSGRLAVSRTTCVLRRLASPGLRPPGEARWYLTVVGLTLLLTAIPTLLAYAQRHDGFGFVGMLWTPPDAAQYFAAMREGAARGSWLIHDHLTTEPHDPVLMYVTFVALGKLAWALGIGHRLTYHLAELGARGVLVLAVLLLAHAALPTRVERRIALVLVLFGSGPFLVAAMLNAVAGRPLALGLENLWQPEFSTVVLLYTAPHMILGVACSLLAVWAYLLAWSGRAWLGAILGIGATCAIGLTNAFSLIPLSVAVAVHLGLMCLRRRRLPGGPERAAGAILLAAGPFIVYNALVFRTSAVWSQTYGAIAGMVSPNPLEVVLLLGGIAILAAPGLASLLRSGTPAQVMVLVWVVCGAVLMYVPLGVERRFALGLQPVLAIAAAPAVVAVWSWIRAVQAPGRACLRPVFLVLLSLALFGSTVPIHAVIFGTALGLTESGLPVASTSERELRPFTSPWVVAFYPLQLEEAADWLERETRADDNLLAAPWTANVLASSVDGRFYVVHGVATPDFEGKAAEVLAVYRSASAHELVAFMNDRQLRYAIYGPYERALGIDAPVSERLRRVFSSNGVDIVELVEPTRASINRHAPD